MTDNDFTLYFTGVPPERDAEAIKLFSRAFSDGEYGREANRSYLTFRRSWGPGGYTAARASAADVVRVWPTVQVVQIVGAAASELAE